MQLAGVNFICAKLRHYGTGNLSRTAYPAYSLVDGDRGLMSYGRMLWYDIFFIHWRVPGAQLGPYIPPGLGLDLFDGDAYVSLVALRVIGPSPGLLLPLSSVFLRYYQLNVRTYVTAGTGRGIVLLDTLVDRILPALGARLFGMPYRFAADLRLMVRDNRVSLHTPDMDLAGEINDLPFTPSEGSLESFLTDRFWVYARMGVTYGMRIEHAPWHLRHVRLEGALPSSITGISGAAEPASTYIGGGLDVSAVELAFVK